MELELVNVLLLIVCFGVLLLLGVPIAFSIGIATIITLLLSMDFIPALLTVAQRMTIGVDSFALLAIPFFILAGQLIHHGGMARRMIDFAKALMGGVRGGLAYVIIMACILFGAISGSAVAAAAAIGGFMIPLMIKEGYDRNFSAALNVTASTTGVLIPPSNVLIIYAFVSGGTSVGALFVAGYLPGIILGLGLMAVAGVISYRKGYAVGETVGLKDALFRFGDALLSLLMVIIVIGGILAGIFTATEASAVAVAYAFLLAVVVYREVKLTDLPRILLDTSKTTAIVMLLIGTSMAMAWMMAFEHIPQAVTHSLLSLTESKIMILILINLILLLIGTFMDVTPSILIFTPIFLPVALELGVDPVHFGIMMVLNLCVGLCTPPVGTVLFVGTGIANTTISKMVKPLLPFYVVMIIWLLVVTFVPWVSMYLPGLFGY